MIRVYVAGPLTVGDPEENLNNVLDAAEKLRELGFAPFVPHLYVHWHARHPHPWEHWMELCLQELRQCRYMIRLPGESYGADVESAYADTIGVPVFKSVEALVKHIGSVGSHHEREWFLNFIRETRKSLEQQRGG